jgi:hypothetical protein
VAKARPALDAMGTPLAFVHGASPDEADPWFAKYGLADAVRVSDPSRAHYRAFGLGRTGVGALVDPKVWTRGTACSLSHGFGPQPVDLMRQLPGIFVVHGDRLLGAFRHRSPADRPDYAALVRSSVTIPSR